ncbi:hypothetical protein LDENG_00110470 [Lucifuga dentata]|nr:hypothetical protein LDENG_00110470 [Lucifuga dentata]
MLLEGSITLKKIRRRHSVTSLLPERNRADSAEDCEQTLLNQQNSRGYQDVEEVKGDGSNCHWAASRRF